jgi:ABC-type transporter lipoprotein component MlaA
MKKLSILTAILLCLINTTYAEELLKQQSKYPDYAYIYLGDDKYEKMNRKVFAFNLGLNKYAIRPIHILWTSIMPEYGIERIQSAYKNIEYPKRLVSSFIQKDFKATGSETVRFLTNTTIGLGGLFDPAKSIFHIEPLDEDMEQALTKCKCNSGPYVVLPVISGVTTRAMLGKLLDTSLNPTTYVGTPILAMVKAGLTVNRTSFIQPLIKMIEENYADPYEIARKMYGINYFIKAENLDRKEILENGFEQPEELPPDVNPELVRLPDLKASSQNDLKISEIVNNNEKLDDILVKNYISDSSKLLADKVIFDYKPQSPVIDSMRTALFDLPDINNSIWNELSVWNRSFANKIKTSSVNITPDKENYKFRYIMQKDKNAPVIIIYPSIGTTVR